MFSHSFTERLWYKKHFLSLILLPISWFYYLYICIRSLAYKAGLLPKYSVDIPVIIVGNISVGGTGKTPLVIWLSNFLCQQGYRPGILSRGYGGKSGKWLQQVRPDSDPYFLGDEPVLLAQRTKCPVAVSPDRYLAAVQLVEHNDCNVLLCDDGLQHLALDRDLEIVVIDGDRRFGNGRYLPAGPLREPVSRLSSVDMIVSKGKTGKNEYLMEYIYGDLISVKDNEEISIDSFKNQTIHSVTGISNPVLFYEYLYSKNIQLIKHVYPDHHNFIPEDLLFKDNLPVVMTEKDAVKCRQFASTNTWYLPIDASFDDIFHHRIMTLTRELFNG